MKIYFDYSSAFNKCVEFFDEKTTTVEPFKPISQTPIIIPAAIISNIQENKLKILLSVLENVKECAWGNGGKVEFIIDDETFVGEIRYISKMIVITDDSDDVSKVAIRTMMDVCDGLIIKCEEGCIIFDMVMKLSA